MFFFSLAIFALLTTWLPWWAWILAAGFMGYLGPRGWGDSLRVALAAGMVWFAASYWYDGRSHGLISQRLSGAFGFSSPWQMLALMGVVGFLSVFLGYKAGGGLRCLLGLQLGKVPSSHCEKADSGL